MLQGGESDPLKPIWRGGSLIAQRLSTLTPVHVSLRVDLHQDRGGTLRWVRLTIVPLMNLRHARAIWRRRRDSESVGYGIAPKESVYPRSALHAVHCDV